MNTVNAKIINTMLGWEDHGIFTFCLDLEFDGCGQGFGLYSLDNYDKKKNARIGTAKGMTILMKVLKTVGVSSWEKLKGTYVRIEENNGGLKKIGHITKNVWFDIAQFSKEEE